MNRSINYVIMICDLSSNLVHGYSALLPELADILACANASSPGITRTDPSHTSSRRFFASELQAD